MITVFTPTYNRAYILPQLYNSLKEQSNKDFEWLVVDDGSTDNTAELFVQWTKEKKVNIRYIKVANGGKHRAINRGVKEAHGELFFIVDSDDKLLPDSLHRIATLYEEIKDDKRFCGLAGSLATPDGQRIGGYFPPHPIDCNALDFRLHHKIKGDMAEVFRTEVMREYPFPEIEGEKFCPESLIWNRMTQKCIMRWIPEVTYVTEYLPDGLSAKIAQLRYDSPQASMMYYSELYHYNIPFVQRFKAAINYWRFAVRPKVREQKMCGIISLLCFIPGKLMRKMR